MSQLILKIVNAIKKGHTPLNVVASHIIIHHDSEEHIVKKIFWLWTKDEYHDVRKLASDGKLYWNSLRSEVAKKLLSNLEIVSEETMDLEQRSDMKHMLDISQRTADVKEESSKELLNIVVRSNWCSSKIFYINTTIKTFHMWNYSKLNWFSFIISINTFDFLFFFRMPKIPHY